jgi:hypothetical protein
MLATGHQIVAANATVGLASLGLVRPAEAVGLTLGALITAAGPFSPDADNRRPPGRGGRARWYVKVWRWCRRPWLPGFHNLEHRETLHGWGWPVLAALILATNGAPLLAYGPVIGWFSHLFPADFMFGKGGRSIPRGIPAAPFGILRLFTPKQRRRRSRRLGWGLRVSASNSAISRFFFGYRDHSVLELAATVVLGVVLVVQVAALVNGTSTG